MAKVNRRRALGLGLAGLAIPTLTTRSRAQPVALKLVTAGPGSGFLPYGQGLAKVINASAVARIEVKESKGSNENIETVEASPTTLRLTVVGAALAAMTGTAAFAGRKHTEFRALFPVYETANLMIALRSSGISSLTALDRKRVGVGPAGGPLESSFRAIATEADINPALVNGTPADLARQLIAGEIDVLAQGASSPIPSLVEVATKADAVVFGFSAEEIDRIRRRAPFIAPLTVPAGTYRGQTLPVGTFAVWNIVIAHREMPETLAYSLTRAVLASPDLVSNIGPAALSTKAENAPAISLVPYHVGAARALAELGVKVESR